MSRAWAMCWNGYEKWLQNRGQDAISIMNEQ